jgi:methionyl-tRNA formyltransferase
LDPAIGARIQVLFEQPKRTLAMRLRAQWRHLRRNGLVWIPYRIYTFLSDALAVRHQTDRPTLLNAVDDLTREFPGRFSVRVVQNLHDPAVLSDLRNAAPDLGVVFGTRILRATLFTIPRLGMVNIHQGKLPNYRGMPPGFWELYNGEQSAGVTLHRVAAELDAGEILFRHTVDIRHSDTIESLQSRLHAAVVEHIASWITSVLSGDLPSHPRSETSGKLYTAPTVHERLELRKRLKRRRQHHSPG